jgi:hypothetical protein
VVEKRETTMTDDEIRDHLKTTKDYVESVVSALQIKLDYIQEELDLSSRELRRHLRDHAHERFIGHLKERKGIR